MADIENKYYQIPMDGVDSQPVKSGRWIQISLGITLLCGFGLAFTIVAQSAFGPTDPMTAAESTNLMGLSTNLRTSSAAGSLCAGSLCIPVTSPYQKIAVAGMKALNEGKSMRDVAMMAHMDQQTKATMDKVENAVVRATAAKDMAGVTAPLGFWDPFGMSTNIPEGKLLWFREAEIKHGRVSMLATLGILVAEKFHPFFGVGAIPSTMVFKQESLNFFWINMVVVCFLLEAPTIQAWKEGNQLEEGYVPGDLGWDPLGLKPKKEADFKALQTRELNNGRLAMFGFLGMIAQELLTGQQIDPLNPPFR